MIISRLCQPLWFVVYLLDSCSILPPRFLVAFSALSTCVSSQDCMEALSNSAQIFNHSNKGIHDEEIASGADDVLCRLLGFLCAKGSFKDVGHADQASSVAVSAQPARTKRVSDETVYMYQITEMVYRCSKAALEPSFQKEGPDFVNIIAKVFAYQLQNHPASNTQPDQESASHLKELKSANRLLLTITKILCHTLIGFKLPRFPWQDIPN